MLFNSLTFFFFLLIVFSGYWLVRERRAQNMLLLVASYVFYGWWDWRFLFLIVGCSAINFWAGYFISSTEEKWKRRLALILCCIVCLGSLCVFKYYNFFIENLCALFGVNSNSLTLKIVLPVGISFFTFQALSYTIDVALGRIKPTKNWVEFFAFIAFFPQLVAGPIERATNLLPQFQRERRFETDVAMHGLCLMGYGLFKKMVVADTLSLYVDKVFYMPELYSSLTCIIGAFFFAIQIYCDFSGYSDVARGVARLFGFELMVNFNRPYLATSFADFWRRWHISLSTWFKDYVYIPLGGNRVAFAKWIRNTTIVFLLSGLWHGAAWTFVIWGGLHGLFLIAEGIGRRRGWIVDEGSGFRRVLKLVGVFVGVAFAWIFFRAGSFELLVRYLKVLFAFHFKTSMMALCAAMGPLTFVFCCVSVGLLAASYLMPRDCRFKTHRAQMAYLMMCAVVIVLFSVPSGGEFIYFKF